MDAGDFGQLRQFLCENLSIRFDKSPARNEDESRLKVVLVLCGEEISSDFQTVREA